MTRRSSFFLLVVTLVVLALDVAIPQDLLPKWIPESRVAEPTVKSPRCTASLDVMTNGNPNCSTDQQYFDTDICKFVCLSTQTPSPPAPTTQKSIVP